MEHAGMVSLDDTPTAIIETLENAVNKPNSMKYEGTYSYHSDQQAQRKQQVMMVCWHMRKKSWRWHSYGQSLRMPSKREMVTGSWGAGKFFLLMFKAAKRKNYGIALTILVQYYANMSPQRQQLLWSRFVHTQGKPGGNKPCDLHNERLNHTIKAAIGGQGSN